MKKLRTVVFLLCLLVLGLFPQKGLCAFSLNLGIAGDGSGSVHSNPVGIACSTVLPGNCTAPFDAGLQVTLTASPSAGSIFAGWDGACTNSKGDCYTYMDANKEVLSTFIYWPVRIYGSSVNYASLLSAYNAAKSNVLIQVQAANLAESPILDKPTTVIIKGGYDNDFNSVSGATTLQGTLTLKNGKVIIGGLVISSDTTSPSVTATRPVSAATNVTYNTALTATFNEKMDATTVNASNFTLKYGISNAVSGKVSYSGTTATFKPDSVLLPNTTYTATITAGVKDQAGNFMASPFSWNFTTGTTPDTIPPSVISTSPNDGVINVDRNDVISAMFSEAMDNSSFNAVTFTVKDSGGVAVSGSITYNDFTKTATFTPSTTLAYARTYTAKISKNVKDLAGNAMSSDKIWSFTTKAPYVSFATIGSFPIGYNAFDLVAADFNLDGKQDLAVTQYDGSNTSFLSVLRGDGTGSFGAKTNYLVGRTPVAIAVADFNGDGKPDMAVANQTSAYPFPPGMISILLGDGTGVFGSATSLNIGHQPRGMVTGDFNGDGIPDLVTASYSDWDVSVLIGTGTGEFSSATSYTGVDYPTSITAGDFNKDGKLDLAVTGGGTVSILLGTGTGSFGEPSFFDSGINSLSVAAGDLNGDGNLDLVIANTGTNHVTVLMGNGTGAFGTGTTVAVGEYPMEAKIVDFNGDGILDLVVTTNFNGGIGTNAVYVILGLGGGTFGTPNLVYYVGNFGVYVPTIAIGDYNGDGKLDIAVADPSLMQIVILLNTTL
jgi:hypothetical protein